MERTVQQIIDRSNQLRDMNQTQRLLLRLVCKMIGHMPTGERLMRKPPVDHCYRCGENYVG